MPSANERRLEFSACFWLQVPCQNAFIVFYQLIGPFQSVLRGPRASVCCSRRTTRPTGSTQQQIDSCAFLLVARRRQRTPQRREGHSTRLARAAVAPTVLPALREGPGALWPAGRAVVCTFAASRESALVFRGEAGKVDRLRHLRGMLGPGTQAGLRTSGH